jgi:predicted nucleic acid-binding protein
VILVDTSVWIDHLRFGNGTLRRLLADDQVGTHPFVLGEIACGGLRKRAEILLDLQALPRAISATDDEVLAFIEERRLWGKGIGWVDAHLLASAVLSKIALWTLDGALNRAAHSVGIEPIAG